MGAYILWMAAVIMATLGTYCWFVRNQWSWRGKHPRTVGTFFYGWSLLLIVAGMDLRGFF